MYICELISNIYNYFNYSILRNSDNNLTENLLEESYYSKHTMTLSNYIENLKTKNRLYQFDEHV
jgi:hypothetical protein